MKRAFTLIELLVIVLIIGILTAIALPQYQVAVKKSRLATVMSNVKAIVDSLEVYYLANGQYPNDDDANVSVYVLDIGISGCSEGAGGVFDCQKESYDYNQAGEVGGFLKNFEGLGYLEILPHATSGFGNPNTRQCWADSESTVANQVCKSLGGTLYSRSSWRVGAGHGHTKNNWNTYLLP